ncbi:unnamed protein product [Durusdinium trenchii]|uniref:Uncharacterized protein n=1 Tax=Durusdinium trenchii TaxID=1381693 RepID=A0ABP0IP97_9DINO
MFEEFQFRKPNMEECRIILESFNEYFKDQMRTNAPPQQPDLDAETDKLGGSSDESSNTTDGIPENFMGEEPRPAYSGSEDSDCKTDFTDVDQVESDADVEKRVESEHSDKASDVGSDIWKSMGVEEPSPCKHDTDSEREATAALALTAEALAIYNSEEP